MYLITYDPETRRVTSCGEVSPKQIMEVLPSGAAYVKTLPGTPMTDYLYTESGEYILSKEEENADNPNGL